MPTENPHLAPIIQLDTRRASKPPSSARVIKLRPDNLVNFDPRVSLHKQVFDLTRRVETKRFASAIQTLDAEDQQDLMERFLSIANHNEVLPLIIELESLVLNESDRDILRLLHQRFLLIGTMQHDDLRRQQDSLSAYLSTPSPL